VKQDRKSKFLQKDTAVPRLVMSLVYVLPLLLCIFATGGHLSHAATQTADTAQAGTLKQIVPGYYAYASGPRVSGVIVTSEGVVVVDALSNDAMARHERQLISDVIGQPVRYLISSSFHGNYSRGNVAYRDALRIGHEDYKADLLDLMEADDVPTAEQEAMLPHLTYRDRMTLQLGEKEIQIIHVGPAHTRGDSIVFVPEDRIVYASEAFFYDRFPFMNSGYLNWIDAIDTIVNLEADIIVPGNGEWAINDPRVTRQALVLSRQVLVDARDAVQREIAQGATEDQVAARVLLQQYEGLIGYEPQSEVMVRRMYQELTGSLP
jgi:cyclase